MINAMFKQHEMKVWHDCQRTTVRFERDENINSTSPSGGLTKM